MVLADGFLLLLVGGGLCPVDAAGERHQGLRRDQGKAVHDKQEADAGDGGAVGGASGNHAAAADGKEGEPPAEEEVFVVFVGVTHESEAAAPQFGHDVVGHPKVQQRDEPPQEGAPRGVADFAVVRAEDMQVFVGAEAPGEGHEGADDEGEGSEDGEHPVGGVGMVQVGQVAEVVVGGPAAAPGEAGDGQQGQDGRDGDV